MTPSVQPSGQPSSQPSAQPSSVPSGQPTSRPTSSVPSSVPTSPPSKYPTTSAPTLPGETNPPTSYPTATPTVNLEDFEDQDAYQAYLDTKADYANTTLSYSFGNFYYKGITVDGVCDTWESLIDDSLKLPFDDLKFSSLSTTFILDDYTTGVAYERTATCSNRNTVQSIISSMQLRTQFDGNCGGNQWRVFVCNSYPVLCANCKENCVETVSCPGTSDIFNPCYTNCDDRIASGSVLNFQYELIPLYPAIRLPLQVSASAVTIDVSFNVSFPGTVYCAALSEGTQLASVVTVLSAGHSAVAHQPDDNITISITGVSPETNYDIYCYTQSLSGHAMPLSEVVASKRTIVTECCRAMVATVTHKSIVQYFPFSGVAESVFSFSLNSPPTGQLGVVLDVSSTRCSGSTTIADDSGSSVVPNTFSFLPTTRFLSGSFVVRGENSGCYVVTGRAIGQDSYTNLTVVTEIRSIRVPPPLVQLESAAFTQDGRAIRIVFSADTDWGEAVLDETYTSFACDIIFSFPGSADAVCYWESDSEVIVEIGSGLELAKVGDTLTLLGDTIRAACVELTDCAAYEYSPQSSHTIAGPANPLVPTALLSVAELVGSCDDINLDATSSSGSGGRPWTSVVWSVTGSDSSYNNADIASFLNTNFANTDEVAILPNQYITAGQSYIFTLALETFLAQSAVVQQTVNVAGTDVVVPQVRIVGSSPESFRWKNVDLYALAVFPDCVVTENVLMSYSWNVYKERTYVPSLVSDSLDPRHFKLSAYKLDAATTYTFQVTVTVKSDISGLELRVVDGVASFQVQMGVSGVTARVSGPSSIKTSASNEVTLDASSSRDLDFPQSESLVFAWTCLQLTPSYGVSCDAAVSPDSAFLTIPVAALSVGTYNLSVIVTNPLGSFGSAFVKIEFTQRIIPIITLNTVQAKYNAQSKITLTGRIQTNGQLATAVWSSTTIPELASTTIPVTPLSKSLIAQTSTFQLGLGANRLTPGLSYSFTLTSSYANIADGASVSVVVVMNSAPRGGVVVANPISGTALTTEYTLVTSQWTDDASDLPLTYIMSYFTLSVNNLFMVKSSSGVASTRTILGQGLENMDYVVRLVATARDIFGGQANTSTSVEVLPIEPTPAVVASSVEALETALEDEDADATTQLIDASVNSINAVDCNVPTACSALNREVCSTTARTCGSCLSGYIGIDRHSNAACQLESMSVSIGGNCTSDALCFSGSCVSGICIDVAKSCPNNCTGLGTCVHTDSDGDKIQFCSISNARCHVACSCPSGTYGSDCSLIEAEYTELLYFRERMCISLFRSMQFQDGSAEVVNARARSVHDLLIDVTQLSSVAVEFCTSVLVDTVAEYPSLSCQGTTPGLIVASLSQIVGVKSTALSAELFANVSIVVEQLSTSCKSQLVLGEDPIALISENLNVLNSLNEQDQLNRNMSFSPPQSKAAKFGAAPTASATIDASGATDDSNAVVGVSVVQYNNNPQGAASNSTGLIVQLDGYRDAPIGSEGRRRRLAVEDGLAVTVVLLNMEPIDYQSVPAKDIIIKCITPRGREYTETRTCPTGFEFTATCPSHKKGNHYVTCPSFTTAPQCTTFDGAKFVEDSSCSVLAYDSLSTTCQCSYPASSPSRSRSLQQLQDSTLTPLSSSSTQYGSQVVINRIDYNNRFDELPELADATQDYVVRGTIRMFGFVACGGIILLLFAELYLQMIQRRKKQRLIANSPVSSIRTVRQFFDSLLPDVFQQPEASWRALLPSSLLQHHTLGSVWYGLLAHAKTVDPNATPKRPSAVKQWLLAVGKLLTFLFMNTLLAYIVYPYDSECVDITSESECEDRKLTAYHHSCEWSERHESCRYRAPDTSAFNVIVFPSIVILASVIYNRVFDWVLSTAWGLQKYPRRDHIRVAPGVLKVVAGGPHNLLQSDRGRRYTANDPPSVASADQEEPDPNNNQEESADHLSEDENNLFKQGGGVDSAYGDTAVTPTIIRRQYDEFRSADSMVLNMLRAARVSLTTNAVLYCSEFEEVMFITEYLARERLRRDVAIRSFFSDYDLPHEQTVYEAQCADEDTTKIVRGVKNSRAAAFNIFQRIYKESNDEAREKLLMRCFIVDSLPAGIRHIAIDELYPKNNFWAGKSFLHSHPNVEVCLAYACITLCSLHYGAMVLLLWQILDREIVSVSFTIWLICLTLSLSVYFLFIEPLTILLREVIIKRQLVAAKVAERCMLLARRAMIILRRKRGLMNNAHALVQHLNPACRVARFYPQLPISRLLLSVNDSDLTKPSLSGNSSLLGCTWNCLKWSPLVLVSGVPVIVGDLFCDVLVAAAVLVIVLGFLWLALLVSPVIAAVVAGGIVGAIAVRESIFLILHVRRRSHEDSSKSDDEEAIHLSSMQQVSPYKASKDGCVVDGQNLDELFLSDISKSRLKQQPSPVGDAHNSMEEMKRVEAIFELGLTPAPVSGPPIQADSSADDHSCAKIEPKLHLTLLTRSQRSRRSRPLAELLKLHERDSDLELDRAAWAGGDAGAGDLSLPSPSPSPTALNKELSFTPQLQRAHSDGGAAGLDSGPVSPEAFLARFEAAQTMPTLQAVKLVHSYDSDEEKGPTATVSKVLGLFGQGEHARKRKLAAEKRKHEQLLLTKSADYAAIRESPPAPKAQIAIKRFVEAAQEASRLRKTSDSHSITSAAIRAGAAIAVEISPDNARSHSPDFTLPSQADDNPKYSQDSYHPIRQIRQLYRGSTDHTREREVLTRSGPGAKAAAELPPSMHHRGSMDSRGPSPDPAEMVTPSLSSPPPGNRLASTGPNAPDSALYYSLLSTSTSENLPTLDILANVDNLPLGGGLDSSAESGDFPVLGVKEMGINLPLHRLGSMDRFHHLTGHAYGTPTQPRQPHQSQPRQGSDAWFTPALARSGESFHSDATSSSLARLDSHAGMRRATGALSSSARSDKSRPINPASGFDVSAGEHLHHTPGPGITLDALMEGGEEGRGSNKSSPRSRGFVGTLGGTGRSLGGNPVTPMRQVGLHEDSTSAGIAGGGVNLRGGRYSSSPQRKLRQRAMAAQTPPPAAATASATASAPSAAAEADAMPSPLVGDDATGQQQGQQQQGQQQGPLLEPESPLAASSQSRPRPSLFFDDASQQGSDAAQSQAGRRSPPNPDSQQGCDDNVA